MGLDLTLIPLEPGDFAFSHTLLPMPRAGFLFKEIMALEKVRGFPVPRPFHTYIARNKNGDTTYGDTQVTPYGEPLCCLRIEDLLGLPAWTEAFRGDRCVTATFSYLIVLDPNRPVALYWR
jgi:hypothetical protein